MKVGIACASGAGKNVFVHGFLAGLEESGLRAEVYGASSSSAVPAAFAAMGRVRELGGVDYWFDSARRLDAANGDVSQSVKEGVKKVIPVLKTGLFARDSKRFFVAASRVVTHEAAELTQGEGARRLGKQLLIATRKKDRSFADANLALRLFDNRVAEGAESVALTGENLAEVLYATTRMLHAWRDAAWIGGEPYVDASYTCMCPAAEVAGCGVEVVIAVSPEAGPLYADFFETRLLPKESAGVRILQVQPEVDLASVGVDYLKGTDEGVWRVFEMGRVAAERALQSL